MVRLNLSSSRQKKVAAAPEKWKSITDPVALVYEMWSHAPAMARRWFAWKDGGAWETTLSGGTWDRDEAPFSAWMLPGFPQRYPRWAQPRMHEIVPPSLLRRYGTEVPLFEPFQGSYWSIRVDRAEALAADLRRRGYHVEWSDVLKGY